MESDRSDHRERCQGEDSLRGQHRFGVRELKPSQQPADGSREAKHREDLRDTSCQANGVLPSAVHDLRRRGIAELKARCDVGQRAMFNRGLPEGEPLAD